MYTTNYFLNIFIFCNKLNKYFLPHTIYLNILFAFPTYNISNNLKLYLNFYDSNFFKSKFLFFLKKKKFLKILIFLLKTNLFKNGHRFKQLQYNFLPKEHLFFFLKKKNKLTNFSHRKRNKKILHYPQFKYNYVISKSLFLILNLFKFKKTYLNLSINRYGSKILLPLIDTMTFGQTFSFYKNLWKFIFFLNIGSIFLLKYITVWCIISQLGLSKSKLIKSFGTFAIITNQYDCFTKIKLPSGFSKIFPNLYVCLVGRNSGKLHFKEYEGKASFNINNKSIKTRSIAKNPVDHPNGGRTPGKSPKKTPWGLIAKKNK